ncbi:response regulator transcription factor [Photobacterium chitinilyticum]|uniref:DNA-binding response regulator n=1 Tax=Photobacterium chitinilyticum TaxID=2485123 RepID=A0A3S3T2F6_9GAMM|nr:response regulator transcription factor [Photobacterium chitinilyticum]RWX57595.1 DNA-binding response regulator [Photobacterium chitinilyticum]
MQMLLVEDDMDLAELIIEYLNAEAIECDIAYNGSMALNLLEENAYQVIVSDVMMPKMDGFTLLENLRSMHIQTPCLMLTARNTLEDKLIGFEKGADDYLVKPFELAELTARIKVLAHRTQPPSSKIKISDLVLDLRERQAYRAGQLLALSAAEWQLLEILVKHSPAVVSKIDIEDHIWGGEAPSKDALKMLIYRLRKVVDSPEVSPLITTVRGRGVMIAAPEDQAQC